MTIAVHIAKSLIGNISHYHSININIMILRDITNEMNCCIEDGYTRAYFSSAAFHSRDVRKALSFTTYNGYEAIILSEHP